jgi:hypothetical protein
MDSKHRNRHADISDFFAKFAPTTREGIVKLDRMAQ